MLDLSLKTRCELEPHALVADIRDALKSVAKLERLWPKGVVHPGGPHYRLEGTLGPVSFGEDECVALGEFILTFQPSNCFIIGNAFGMSAAYIAKAMEACGGTSVVTLDNKSEGDGERCADVAARLRDRVDARILSNQFGFSPRDIGLATAGTKFDLVLIDGLHAHPQVTDDFHGVKAILDDNGVICWHDYWLDGVPESVATAEGEGFHCTKVNTSGELVFGTRDKEVFDRIKTLFPASVPPVKKTQYMALARLYTGLLRAGLRRRLSLT